MPRWISKALLRCYPPKFRRTFGDELQDTIARDWRRIRRDRGVARRVHFWITVIWDSLSAAIRLHWDGVVSGIVLPAGWSRVLVDDLIQGGRAFQRGARFQLLAGLLLALGIGSSAAAFAVVNGVLMEDLPYPESSRLVQIGSRPPQNPEWMAPLSEVSFLAMARGISQLEALVAVSDGSRILRGTGDPVELSVASVSSGYLDVLGASASHGRTLQPSDYEPGASRVVVLSPSFFQKRFGGDPRAVGEVVDLGGEPVQIVGVLSPSFVPPPGIRGQNASLWTPLGLSQGNLSPVAHLDVIGRLRPGTQTGAVQEEADQILGDQIYSTTPEDRRPGARVEFLRSRVLGNTGPAILLAQAGLALLLLLTCVNVAILLIARASARRREMAVRRALGARREQLVRQLLMESLLLALLAGGAGLGLALVLVRWFKAGAPLGIPLLPTVAVDGDVIVFSLLLSLASSILFGFLPALTSSHVDPARVIGTRRGCGPGSKRASTALNLLVGGGVALAVILSLGGGLLANSFLHLTRIDLGYQPHGLGTLRVEMYGSELNREHPGPFLNELLDAGRTMPGVSAAALGFSAPLVDRIWRGPFTPQDLDPSFEDQRVFVNINAVSDGYFATMEIPILRGRDFEDGDAQGQPGVVVVNQAFARSFWPSAEDVVGRIVQEVQGREARTYRVVGLVGDVRHTPGSGDDPTLYFPLSHLPHSGVGMNLLVRGGEQTPELGGRLRDLIRRLDPSLPVPEFTTLDRLLEGSVVKPRFYSTLAMGLALLALLLALAGVYGTTSYVTSQRTGEIGIRMALGADRVRAVGEILHGTSRTALTGIALGLVGGWLGSGNLEALLFGIEPMNIPTYVVVALMVGTAVTLAGLVPARRAARIDPAETLREESGR